MSPDKDSFRWDECQNQPHNDLSRWQKVWGSRLDLAAHLALVGRNVRQLFPVLSHYRQELARPELPHLVTPRELGLAIAPTVETWERYVHHVVGLGVGSVLLRVPVWEPDSVLALGDRLAELRARGVELTFVLVQDREAVLRPERWASFAQEVVSALAPLAPTFQIGQVLNRKKWGIWRSDEYLRLVEGVAPARLAAPGCHFIGPPVIDFEYHFTVDYLARRRPFDFDGITSLLYVDRRGSPDTPQYGHFGLREKILLLHSIVAASSHPPVPIHLTEFNWPLRGFGAWAPAGHGVQIDEARQARYLVLYYLTAAATGLVAASFWWQLVARGYGLLLDDPDWSPRPAYHALAELVKRLAGCCVTRLPHHLRPLRGFLLEHDGERTVVAYSPERGVRLSRPELAGAAHSVLGNSLSPRALSLGPDPTYLCFGAVPAETVLEALIPR
jgi:hypothetical protein